MSLGVILIIYFLIAILAYLFFSTLIAVNKGVDREFDEAMEDGSARMLALIFSSLIWPISIGVIIYDNVVEVFKNGRN